MSISDSPELTIFDLPIEIIFYIFTVQKDEDKYQIIENVNNNNNNDNNNNNNDQDLMKSALKFSFTCKVFYKLFQEDIFWYQNYKSIYQYYSLVDVDNRCLSSLSMYNIKAYNDSGDGKNSCSSIGGDGESSGSSGLSLMSKENVQEQTWKDRYFNRNYRWNPEKIDCVLKIPDTHISGITSLEVDDRYLYSGSHDSQIWVYSLDNLQPLLSFQGHKYTIWALKSDGKRLYSASNDHTIRVWDLKKQQLKSTITDQTKIFSMSLTDKLLLSSSDNVIKVWKKKDGLLLSTLQGHTGGVNSIYTGESNDRMVSGSSDRSIRVWDLNTLQCIDSKIDSQAKVLSLTMLDHNLVAVGTQNCQIKIWDLRMDTPVKTKTKAHSWDVWQLRMCGGYLFSGSFDHTIKMWDINNLNDPVRTLSNHRSYIHALTSSSYHLFSGSADKSIRVWTEYN